MKTVVCKLSQCLVDVSFLGPCIAALLDVAYCYRWSTGTRSMVDLCVRHTSEPCKNG